MAASSSVETALYSLSTCFQQLGREGPWNNDQLTGNPTSCQRMRKWLVGYHKKSCSEGFKSTGAQEFTQETITDLMQHLQKQLLEP